MPQLIINTLAISRIFALIDR